MSFLPRARLLSSAKIDCRPAAGFGRVRTDLQNRVIMNARLSYAGMAVILAAFAICGCQSSNSTGNKSAAQAAVVSTNQGTAATTGKAKPIPKRYSYTPKPYPVDDRGFSPVDKTLAKAYAREDMVVDDAEGSLNPYVLKVISGYPVDGTYPYHCAWGPWEYDIYNGVTQDMWFKGMVVAKAYPDGSRCSYCCGFTFEVFVRAMKLRNIQKGLDADDFNGMTFNDLFNALQLWYIEGKGDSEERAISFVWPGTCRHEFGRREAGRFCELQHHAAGRPLGDLHGLAAGRKKKDHRLQIFFLESLRHARRGLWHDAFQRLQPERPRSAPQFPAHRPRRGDQGLCQVRSRQNSPAQCLRADAAQPDSLRARAGGRATTNASK